jgi:hypothetical protein
MHLQLHMVCQIARLLVQSGLLAEQNSALLSKRMLHIVIHSYIPLFLRISSVFYLNQVSEEIVHFIAILNYLEQTFLLGLF